MANAMNPSDRNYLYGTPIPNTDTLTINGNTMSVSREGFTQGLAEAQAMLSGGTATVSEEEGPYYTTITGTTDVPTRSDRPFPTTNDFAQVPGYFPTINHTEARDYKGFSIIIYRDMFEATNGDEVIVIKRNEGQGFRIILNAIDEYLGHR